MARMSKFTDILPFKVQTLFGRIPCELYLTNISKSNKSPSKLTIFTDPTKKTNQNPPINSESQQHKQRNSSKHNFFWVKKETIKYKFLQSITRKKKVP